MAGDISVRLTDDLDGSEAQETVSFGLRGVTYEIDLNTKNAAALDKALAKYVEAGQRIPQGRSNGQRSGRRTAGSPSGEVGTIRSWAREHGYEVSDRGRISGEIRDAYAAANT